MKATGMRTAALLSVLCLLGGLVGCSALRGTWNEGRYEIAGGGRAGVYYSYGDHLATALSANLGASITVVETNGSVENLLRIGEGRALLGFAQSDTAADAVAGVGAFSERLPIRAVANLYDEYVHLVVRADSDILGIDDLAGRRISLGAENSGVNVVATRILDAAGVPADTVQNPQLGLASSIEAMEDAEIEGFFWIGGLPTPGIEQLTDRTPIRLLSIEAGIVEQVNAEHAGVYRLAEFPSGVYGRGESTLTMTVPSYLVTSADAPEDFIRDILRVLFDERVQIAQHVPAAALLDRRQAIFTNPIELHPGAIAYYSETRR